MTEISGEDAALGPHGEQYILCTFGDGSGCQFHGVVEICFGSKQIPQFLKVWLNEPGLTISEIFQAHVTGIEDQLCLCVIDDIRNIIEKGCRSALRRFAGKDNIVLFRKFMKGAEKLVQFLLGYLGSRCVEDVFLFAGNFDVDAAGAGYFNTAIMN